MKIKKFNESKCIPFSYDSFKELFLNVCEKYDCVLTSSSWDYNTKNRMAFSDKPKGYKFSLKIPKKFWNGGERINTEKVDSIGSDELRGLCEILIELPKIADRIKSLYNHELTFSLSTINQCAIYMTLKDLSDI